MRNYAEKSYVRSHAVKSCGDRNWRVDALMGASLSRTCETTAHRDLKMLMSMQWTRRYVSADAVILPG